LWTELARWAGGRPDLRAVALVGSRARGEARPDSDVDLVFLTDDPAAYIERDDWAFELGARAIVRTRRWGVLVERRLAMPDGPELDVGIVSPSWASTAPLDPGTARVAREGLVALHDPDGLLAALVEG
jgi:hypothetical protein